MPEQIFFEDTPAWRGEEEEKKITPIVPEEEPLNCRYCQDGDVPCTYCKRGKEKIAEEKNKPRERVFGTKLGESGRVASLVVTKLLMGRI